MSLLQVQGEMGVVSFDPDNDVHEDGQRTWAKIRCAANDRVRDSDGKWSDGDPCFIDVYINGKQALNLKGSIRVGDKVVVTGKLAQKEWTDKEGGKHEGYRIYAEEFGVSLRWAEAPSERVRNEGTQKAPLDPSDPWAEPPEGFDEPPF